MQRLVTILRFVRFPLVWTALADSLAGAAVAAASCGGMPWANLAPLLLISPALYLCGMGLNDVLDLPDDRRAGRDRPMVRGELSFRSGLLTVIFLLGLALIGAAFVNLAAQTMVALTLVAIAAYNSFAKRWTATGIPLMATCRVGNVLIGWTVVNGSWRFDLSPQAPYAWTLLAVVATLTAVASLASALEKRYGCKTLAGASPSAVVLGALLLLPVADAACVAWAWHGAAWFVLWLAAVPLVLASSAALRRARRRCQPIGQ